MLTHIFPTAALLVKAPRHRARSGSVVLLLFTGTNLDLERPTRLHDKTAASLGCSSKQALMMWRGESESVPNL